MRAAARDVDKDKLLKLRRLLAPRAVAVIGASSRAESIGRAVFANVLLGGYAGIVYPVNPNAKSVLGVRAYASVTEVPDEIDLAVVVVPARVVPQVLEECGKKGIPGAIVISAGFKEIGPQGAAAEEQVEEIVARHGFALVGPNCLGLINTDPAVSLNATFARSSANPGTIAFISQSGAVGVAALEYAQSQQIGLSKFVSVGNKADVHENHLLSVLADDALTEVILLYLEDLEDPKGFIELAREVSDRKPILAIKSGRTTEGAQAAASHTGALAGSDEAYDSLFAQCGVLRADSLEDLFDFAIAFAHQPRPQGNRVAIVTNAGGPGIMATDACVRHGLRLAEFAPETKTGLRAVLPSTARAQNPLDLIGDAGPERYEGALRCVLADESVDSLLVLCTPQMLTDLEAMARIVAREVERAREGKTDLQGKPVLACFMALGNIAGALRILDAHQIPHYPFPEDAARALAALARYGNWVRRPRTEIKRFADVDAHRVREIIAQAQQEQRTFLPESEAHTVLHAYGFPVLRSALARDEDEALQLAREIGYPVVLKIVSPDILHKVDVGGVKLNIAEDSSLTRSYRELLESVRSARPRARLWGVLVQEYMPKGTETILGMKQDHHFGPLLMFGLGGIYVEVFKDVTFRIAPIRELSAQRMIEGIRGHKILMGYRGQPPADIPAIAECLERLSQLALDFPQVAELDINPLLVFKKGRGARVLDARIILRSAS